MKYENEEDIRKDFARIFNWYEYKSDYGYSQQNKVIQTPEWAEIFSKVGELIEKSRDINEAQFTNTTN
jgi:hypothetical protein